MEAANAELRQSWRSGAVPAELGQGVSQRALVGLTSEPQREHSVHITQRPPTYKLHPDDLPPLTEGESTALAILHTRTQVG